MQEKESFRMREELSFEKNEDEVEQEMEKQRSFIKKDWTGERNTKIMGVQKSLVERMARKLNKPLVKAQYT